MKNLVIIVLAVLCSFTSYAQDSWGEDTNLLFEAVDAIEEKEIILTETSEVKIFNKVLTYHSDTLSYVISLDKPVNSPGNVLLLGNKNKIRSMIPFMVTSYDKQKYAIDRIREVNRKLLLEI